MPKIYKFCYQTYNRIQKQGSILLFIAQRRVLRDLMDQYSPPPSLLQSCQIHGSIGKVRMVMNHIAKNDLYNSKDLLRRSTYYEVSVTSIVIELGGSLRKHVRPRQSFKITIYWFPLRILTLLVW